MEITTEQKLKRSLNGLIWLFETMMDAADIDLDETEVAFRNGENDELLGEKQSLAKILEIFKKDAE